MKAKFCDSNTVFLENFFDASNCKFVTQQHIPDFEPKTFVRVAFFFYQKWNKQTSKVIYIFSRTNNMQQLKTEENLIKLQRVRLMLCVGRRMYINT